MLSGSFFTTAWHILGMHVPMRVLNKQLWAADKRWSSDLGLHVGPTFYTAKRSVL